MKDQIMKDQCMMKLNQTNVKKTDIIELKQNIAFYQYQNDFKRNLKNDKHQKNYFVSYSAYLISFCIEKNNERPNKERSMYDEVESN